MPALQEEYRPSTWETVVGQDKAVKVCKGLIGRGLGGRAIWIAGQSGTGKYDRATVGRRDRRRDLH